MNGIINVYKEKGYTSHDVVAKLRGILQMRKIGHTGTLDPEATGVLPVCVGKATKVCDLLTNKDKTYIAQVQLGITTDTYDMTGEILTEQKAEISEEQIRTVISSFRGEINQIPPMYSAIKVNGKRLYELARQGKEVERKERKVTIYHLEITNTDYEKQQFTMEVQCSKGTYIRSLCHDIGQALGYGATMKSLIRTHVGDFDLEHAYTLEEIESYVKAGKKDSLLLPIDAVFERYPRCEVTSEGMRYLKNGNVLRSEFCFCQGVKNQEYVRMYGTDGEFYAIYRFNRKRQQYQVVKMFHVSEKS